MTTEYTPTPWSRNDRVQDNIRESAAEIIAARTDAEFNEGMRALLTAAFDCGMEGDDITRMVMEGVGGSGARSETEVSRQVLPARADTDNKPHPAPTAQEVNEALVKALEWAVGMAEEAITCRETNPDPEDTDEIIALHRASLVEAQHALRLAQGAQS